MVIVILLIIAFWFMYNAGAIPLALAVLMTVFGTLHCVIRLVSACVKAYKEQQLKRAPQKTGYNLLDRFIKQGIYKIPFLCYNIIGGKIL